MPSFDIVSEVNEVEVNNAVDQTNKEVSTRFDFKGSDARVEHKEKVLTLFADDDFKLSQVTDILTGKLTKRTVDIRSLKYGDVEKVSATRSSRRSPCVPESSRSCRRRSFASSRTAR